MHLPQEFSWVMDYHALVNDAVVDFFQDEYHREQAIAARADIAHLRRTRRFITNDLIFSVNVRIMRANEVLENALAVEQGAIAQDATAAPRDTDDLDIDLDDLDVPPQDDEGKKKKARPITYKRIVRLTPAIVAYVMIQVFHVVRLTPSDMSTDPEYDILAIYDSDKNSDNYGLYVTSLSYIRAMVDIIAPDMSQREFDEVISKLHTLAPRTLRGRNRDIVACHNGIFHYDTKRFDEFSHRHIFTSKLDTNYNPNASEPPIIYRPHETDAEPILTQDAYGEDVVMLPANTVETWDVDSWVADLFDDPELEAAIWEQFSAVVRPYVPWGKAAFWYSTVGNNGKGTLLSLIRGIVGNGYFASVSLSDFGHEFKLEALTNASAVLVDENNVNAYIDKAADFKAAVTGDVLFINRKFKKPVSYTFYGFVIQCLNDYPRISDKSESFYRRQLFIPFTKSFTGKEDKAIKNDYIHRKEVREYVLYKILHSDFYELSEPAASKDALQEFKVSNDPIRAFWEDVEDQLVWDLVPFDFLYALYQAWMTRFNPQGKPVNKRTFITDIIALVNAESDIFECEDKRKKHRPAQKMIKAELLIHEYDLPAPWRNPVTHKNSSPTQISTLNPHNLKVNYMGITRIK